MIGIPSSLSSVVSYSTSTQSVVSDYTGGSFTTAASNNKPKGNIRLTKLLSLPENTRCCDCSDMRPTWAAIVNPPAGAPPGSPTIGLFCCLHCSAAYRNLLLSTGGNQKKSPICQVKSVRLDRWDEKEIQAMERGGNLRVNSIFEGALFNDTTKPTPLVDAAVREQFIEDKYLKRKYFTPNAYKCVGTEDEDEDEDIIDDEEDIQTVSVLASVKTRLAGGGSGGNLASIAEVIPRNSSLTRMTSTSRIYSGGAAAAAATTTKSRPAFPRQSSLPDFKLSRQTSLSRLATNEGIAKPFRREMDFWESMNNSTWCDLTFEHSLHKKSTVDLAIKEEGSEHSWGLEDKPLPLDRKEGASKRGKPDRRNLMSKKIMSERCIRSDSLLLRGTSTREVSGDSKKLDRRLAGLPKHQSERNISSSSGSKPRKERASRSNSDPQPKAAGVLHTLEDANKERMTGAHPRRNRSDPIKGLDKAQSMRSINRVPSRRLDKAHSVQDIGRNPRSSSLGKKEARRLPPKTSSLNESRASPKEGKSRSLSPKTYRKNRLSDSSTKSGASRSSQKSKASSSGRHKSLEEACSKSFAELVEVDNVDSPPRPRPGSCDTPRSRRRKNSSNKSSITEDTPTPPTLESSMDNPQVAPTNRKVLNTPKSAQPKYTKRSQLSAIECPNSVPRLPKLVSSSKLVTNPSRLSVSRNEDSLEKLSTNEHVEKARKSKPRPRSLESNTRNKNRKSAARTAKLDELKAASEHVSHSDLGLMEHPLFAYPISSK